MGPCPWLAQRQPATRHSDHWQAFLPLVAVYQLHSPPGLWPWNSVFVCFRCGAWTQSLLFVGELGNVEGSLLHGLICFIPAEFQTTEVLERRQGRKEEEGGKKGRKGLQGKLLTSL